MGTLGPQHVPSPSISLMIRGSQRGTMTLFLSVVYGSWYQTGKIQLLNSYGCPDLVLQSRFVHPELPPLPGATAAFCSKQLCWLQWALGAWQPLTQPPHYGEQVEKWVLLWVLWLVYTSLLVGGSATTPTSPPGKAISCTCKAPSHQQHWHIPSATGCSLVSLWQGSGMQGLGDVSCSWPVSSQPSTRWSEDTIFQKQLVWISLLNHIVLSKISQFYSSWTQPLLDVNKKQELKAELVQSQTKHKPTPAGSWALCESSL